MKRLENLFLPLSIFFILLQVSVAFADTPVSSAQQRVFEQEGEKSFTRGAYAQARVYFERLVRAFPDQDRYWLAYGSSLYNSGDTKRALEAYNRAIRLRGDLRLVAALYAAEIHRRQGKLRLAKKIVYWILRQNPIPPNFLQEVLLVYDLLQDGDEPESKYEELVRLGVSFYRRENYAQARSYFDGALTLQRTDETRLLTALTELRRDNYVLARDLLIDLQKDVRDEFVTETTDSFLKELVFEKQQKLWFWTKGSFEFEQISFEQFSASSAVFRPELDLGYRIWSTPNWLLSANYHFQWNQLLTPEAELLLRHRAGVRLGYYGEQWQASSGLRLGFSHFVGEAFLLRFISDFMIGRHFQDSLLSLTYGFVSTSSLADAFSNLSGPASLAKLDWTFYEEFFTWSIWATYALDKISDSVINGTRIPLRHSYARVGTIIEFGIGKNWLARTGHSVGRKRFLERTIPGETLRTDVIYDGLIGFGIRGKSKISADLDVHYTGNNSKVTNSNASDQRFRETIFCLSLFWDINP